VGGESPAEDVGDGGIPAACPAHPPSVEPQPAAAAAPVRAATREDLPELLRLVRALARYERAPDEVTAQVADFDRALFGQPPVAAALVAGGAAPLVGMVVFYRTFSTWTGRPGLHVEDLYVEPAARGRGIGRALLSALAGICVREALPRLEWNVLEWNAPAIGFYEALGARPQQEWRGYRLSGPALSRLADAAPIGGVERH
jgi:ribosomal protein S18 acetylase RimI-like enzyme